MFCKAFSSCISALNSRKAPQIVLVSMFICFRSHTPHKHQLLAKNPFRKLFSKEMKLVIIDVLLLSFFHAVVYIFRLCIASSEVINANTHQIRSEGKMHMKTVWECDKWPTLFMWIEESYNLIIREFSYE